MDIKQYMKNRFGPEYSTSSWSSTSSAPVKKKHNKVESSFNFFNYGGGHALSSDYCTYQHCCTEETCICEKDFTPINKVKSKKGYFRDIWEVEWYKPYKDKHGNIYEIHNTEEAINNLQNKDKVYIIVNAYLDTRKKNKGRWMPFKEFNEKIVGVDRTRL